MASESKIRFKGIDEIAENLKAGDGEWQKKNWQNKEMDRMY